METRLESKKGALIMKCITCGSATYSSTTTDVVDIDSCLIIVRNVPCHKCSVCNEILYSGTVAKRLEIIIENAKQAMNEIAIIDFNSIAA